VTLASSPVARGPLGESSARMTSRELIRWSQLHERRATALPRRALAVIGGGVLAAWVWWRSGAGVAAASHAWLAAAIVAYAVAFLARAARRSQSALPCATTLAAGTCSTRRLRTPSSRAKLAPPCSARSRIEYRHPPLRWRDRPRAGPHISGERMFDHVKFGVSDYAASKAFFLKALEPLSVAVVAEGSPTYGASSPGVQGRESPASRSFLSRGSGGGWQSQWCAWSAPTIQRELLCSFRHWSGRAQHRSGLPRTRGVIR
jgi:hypothetical protein